MYTTVPFAFFHIRRHSRQRKTLVESGNVIANTMAPEHIRVHIRAAGLITFCDIIAGRRVKAMRMRERTGRNIGLIVYTDSFDRTRDILLVKLR